MALLLNDEQKKGVITTEGPVLILAGAGSGKTRVLTERIAYLIREKNVAPYQIMAITFTNKAADEMRERVDASIGMGAQQVWVATFHASCVRILRRFGDRLGYKSGFSIYDTDDTKTVMKEVLKRLNIDAKKFPPKSFLNKISSAKNELQTPEKVAAFAGNDPAERQLARVYQTYQERLKEQNAFDFDDLIMQTVRLFQENEDVLAHYQEHFRYIMVDEYQDTNTAQFELVHLLAQAHQNICVVGDDDQSIYKFRGANILNILNFEHVFTNATVIRLEQNYRSTKKILDAANSVIHHNEGRKTKTLWTNNADGEKIKIRQFDSAYEEADYIVRKIEKAKRDGAFDYEDIAILYRTNMQSRILEEKFLLRNLPYRIVGGVNFYSRKEIKDILAYLKTIDNAADDLAALRIINVPRRGIGQTTIARIVDYAAMTHTTFYEALKEVEQIPDVARSASKIRPFMELIEELKRAKETMTVPELMKKALEDTGYIQMLQAEHTDEAATRIENLEELLNKAIYFEREHPRGKLEDFLEEVALIADIDQMEAGENRVRLMTLHAAKGLEFAMVFMAGMEDGLFPGEMTIISADNADMEEERRLCYVGITRAKEQLTMTAARHRMMRGETRAHHVSRFIKEIRSDLLDSNLVEGKKQEFLQEARRMPSVSPRHTAAVSKATSTTVSYEKKLKEITKGRQIEKTDLAYSKGDRVSHIKFGEGTVVSIVDGGRDYEVTVDFDMAGAKKMFASFARLKKM